MLTLREKIRRGLKRPHRIPPYAYNTRVKPAYNRLKYAVYRRYSDATSQTSLIDQFILQDEFALIVLDACRFDYFEQQHDDYLLGELQTAWSPANNTPGWLPAVWGGSNDLTYVSANPNAGTYEYDMDEWRFRLSDHISEVIDVWDFGWDFKVQATLPDVVTDVSLEVAARDVPTRMVVHYLQPHQPYCGEYRFDHWVETAEPVAESVSETQRHEFLSSASELTMEEVAKYEAGWGDLRKYDISLPDRGGKPLLEQGKITEEDLRRAYESNLDLVLAEVQRLVERLDCPVVVTSDHGELLGERDEYMHPTTSDVAHRILREVPWFVVDPATTGTEKNDVESSYLEDSAGLVGAEESEIEERLSQLGYE